MTKENKLMKCVGFTLIEAIVTAVIMAILAAVAIPMYVGYINDQKQTTVNNLAETAAAAANAFKRRTGTNPNTDQLQLYYDANKYTVTVTTGNNTVSVQDRVSTSFYATRSY